MAEQPLIKKDALTAATVDKCLELYPETVKAVYKATRPKLDQSRLLESDRWRYSLPAKTYYGEGITKKELLRLVQWKIAHGVNRPFLPGMVDKNSAEDVKKCTAAAAKVLGEIDRTTSKAEIVAAVKTALTEVCKLKGVGPATGTLVMSIFKPDVVPFFQDETFYWITANYDTKLKYDKKEYAKLFDKILAISLRLDVDAVKLEKTAYVLSHANHLSSKHKQQLKDSADATAASSVLSPPKFDPEALKEALSTEKKRKRSDTKAEMSGADSKVRSADAVPPRRSKRQKPEAHVQKSIEPPDT